MINRAVKEFRELMYRLTNKEYVKLTVEVDEEQNFITITTINIPEEYCLYYEIGVKTLENKGINNVKDYIALLYNSGCYHAYIWSDMLA